MIALTKIELIDKKELKEKKKSLEKSAKKDVFLVSSATTEGVEDVLRELKKTVQQHKKTDGEHNPEKNKRFFMEINNIEYLDPNEENINTQLND
jgi:GTPase involved in cell partitioning and DNA repair